MDIVKELRECLALQQEIDAKTLGLRQRFKAVLESERAKGNSHTIVVQIDDQFYALEREDSSSHWMREAHEAARELGGFYFYRLVKTGKLYK